MNNVNLDLIDAAGMIQPGELEACLAEANAVHARILAGEAAYHNDLGWLAVEKWAGEARLAGLEQMAAGIRAKTDAFVVVGIGGSNQAARAAIEALRPAGGPEIVYMGNTLSAAELARSLAQLQGKRFCINVIAKNFETLEPGLSFRLLREELAKRHGPAACEYIYTTATPGSYFEQLSREQGYQTLVFPPDIGGRFSALSDVGLLPMAVAGVNIRALVAGAHEAQAALAQAAGAANPALLYAVVRNLLHRNGYRMEMLAFFEPRLRWFGRWWTQLFAESEGKEDTGLYPVLGEYTEDLHSIGQYVQEGAPVLFETFLTVDERDTALPVPTDGVDDRFGYLDGADVWDVNHTAQEATIEAHSGRLPCLRLALPRLDEAALGRLFYLNMFACYVSGSMLGVNPFNQNGVEAYKQRMFTNLGKQI